MSVGATAVAGKRRATPVGDRTGYAALRGDIEGLRAIAVGTVLLYHVGISRLSGGFAGVDIFFVISGFLITSLLLREATRTGRISLTTFYARRARRLLPAASIVLVFTAVAGWYVLPASRHADLATDVTAATLYVVNWALAFRSVNYLAEDAGVSPVQHYWSLSVEEQYYLVWPLMMILGLYAAHRWSLNSRRLLLLLIGGTAVASFVYSVVHTRSEPATSYFFTTTRVWELAIGSLLAFAAARLRVSLGRRAAEILGWVGLALIAVAVFTFTSATPWPGSAALVPTLGAAAIIAAGCATQETGVGRLLGLRPMMWLGGISYSVYLWHWPLLILAAEQWPSIGLAQKVGIGGVAVVLAWLTKRFVEDPVRFNPTLAKRNGLALAMGGLVMALSLGAAAAVRNAVPDLDLNARTDGATALVANPDGRDWRLIADPASIFDRSGRVVPDPAVARLDVPTYYDQDCQVEAGKEELLSGCSFAVRDSDRTMAMLGDSKSGQWFPAVEDIAVRERWRLDLYIKSACSFSLAGVDDDCSAYTRNVLDSFRRGKAPDFAFVSQGSVPSPERTQGMVEALGELRALGTEVILVADNPRPGDENVYECVDEHPTDYSACAFEKGYYGDGAGTPPLRDVAKEMDLPLIDLNRWICPPEDASTCPPVIDGTLLYRQGSHLTATYIRTLSPMLHRSLSELGIARTPIGEISVDQVARTRRS
ncbi:MAG: acyltransferase family protein [Nocardioides sp.]